MEAFKAPVRQVLQVVQTVGRRVRQQDVKAAASSELGRKVFDARLHLLFGVHIFSLAVAVGAAQTQNAQTVHIDQPVVGADTALRLTAERVVVVAVDIDQRTVRQRHQKLNVFGTQIAAREDQIEFVEPSGLVEFVEAVGGNIGNRQNPHDSTSASGFSSRSSAPSVSASCFS